MMMMMMMKNKYLKFFDLLLQLGSQRLFILDLTQKLGDFKVLPVKYSTSYFSGSFSSMAFHIVYIIIINNYSYCGPHYFFIFSSDCCLSFSRSMMDSWASFRSPSSFLLDLSRSMRSFFSCSREPSSCTTVYISKNEHTVHHVKFKRSS